MSLGSAARIHSAAVRQRAGPSLSLSSTVFARPGHRLGQAVARRLRFEQLGQSHLTLGVQALAQVAGELGAVDEGLLEQGLGSEVGLAGLQFGGIDAWAQGWPGQGAPNSWASPPSGGGLSVSRFGIVGLGGRCFFGRGDRLARRERELSTDSMPSSMVLSTRFLVLSCFKAAGSRQQAVVECSGTVGKG